MQSLTRDAAWANLSPYPLHHHHHLGWDSSSLGVISEECLVLNSKSGTQKTWKTYFYCKNRRLEVILHRFRVLKGGEIAYTLKSVGDRSAK